MIYTYSLLGFIFYYIIVNFIEWIDKKLNSYKPIYQYIIIEEDDKFIKASPSNEFMLEISLDYNNSLINNNLKYHSNSHSFKNNIARARTFCFKNEIDKIKRCPYKFFSI